jgi:hypothetical protein
MTNTRLCDACGGAGMTSRLDWSWSTGCATLPFVDCEAMADQLIALMWSSEDVPHDPAEFFAADSLLSWVEHEAVVDAVVRHPQLTERCVDWLGSRLSTYGIPFRRPWDNDPIPPDARDIYSSHPIFSFGGNAVSRAAIIRGLGSAYTIVPEHVWKTAVFPVLNQVRDLETMRDGVERDFAEAAVELAYKFASNAAFSAGGMMDGYAMPTILFAEGFGGGDGMGRWPQQYAWVNRD